MERGFILEISDISWVSFDLSFGSKITCKLITSSIIKTSVAGNSACHIMAISPIEVQ